MNRMHLMTIVAWCWVVAPPVRAEDRATAPNGFPAKQGVLLAPGGFVHIPGPNPILVTGSPGAWDDGVIEAADAFADGGTYHFYYHGTGRGKGYRLGVATARHPLGPFTKHGDKPILDLGPPGSWDDCGVACAMVLKEVPGKYLMWYSGRSETVNPGRWGIGLAAAAHPLGPWTKYAGNPILKDFGYVGGVVKVAGKYHLYTEHPIGSTGPDYGPMSLAVADSPTGPWSPWPKNPVVGAGRKGDWDDGGFSEGEVLHWGGMFHLFYGGAKIQPERIRTLESIGYAHSTDGRRFVKSPANPVAPREACPNVAAMSEVHAIIEPPFVFLYHTLRYKEPRTEADRKKFPVVEDLGVEVLATTPRFRIDVPLVNRDKLDPKARTTLEDARPLCLSRIAHATLTMQCGFSAKATGGLRLDLHRSADGIRWNAADRHAVEIEPRRGEVVRRSFPLDVQTPFVKIVVENLDPSESVSRLKIAAELANDSSRP